MRRGDNFDAGSCIEKTSSKSVNLRQLGHEPQTWMFDHVAGEDTTQEEMFRGKPSRPHLPTQFNFRLAGSKLCFSSLYPWP